jgi:hypothetical protein
VALIVGSIGLITWGGSGFVKCQRRVKSLETLLGRDQGFVDLGIE